jgi:nicotinamide mononucleotide (NMN) deamidase PncC
LQFGNGKAGGDTDALYFTAGIAGPGGGSEEKPVGLVHLALASASGVKERAVRFPGDRDMVRLQASQAALDMVRMHFLYNGVAKRG